MHVDLGLSNSSHCTWDRWCKLIENRLDIEKVLLACVWHLHVRLQVHPRSEILGLLKLSFDLVPAMLPMLELLLLNCIGSSQTNH